MGANSMGIRLEIKKQLSEAIDSNDDWTGLKDAAARRKKQNRLHQRAWRRRKALQTVSAPPPGNSCRRYDQTTARPQAQGFPIYEGNASWLYYHPFSNVAPNNSSTFQISEDMLLATERMQSSSTPKSSQDGNSSVQSIVPSHTAKLVPPLLPYLDTASSTWSFDHNHWRFTFPLPQDQRLITLSQYNVLRASLTNMKIMSLLHTLPAECGAAFTIATLPTPSNIPSSLQPTPLQQTVPHETWIDCLPVAAFRDNLILNSGNFDFDDFCTDLVGGLYEGFDDVQLRGVLVWSDPWCADGWEVTEGFAKKWGFLLKGCDELIEATNRYRESRYEDRLIVEL